MEPSPVTVTGCEALHGAGSSRRSTSKWNTIVIMTSNLGSHLIQEKLSSVTEENREELMGDLRVSLFEMLRQTVRPEFLNRIDEIILFKPLIEIEIRQIVELQLKQVQRMASEKNITLEFSPEIASWLGSVGYDPAFGARPLKRVIQKYVVNPLSEKILSGDIGEGDSVEVGLDNRGMAEFITKVRAKVV